MNDLLTTDTQELENAEDEQEENMQQDRFLTFALDTETFGLPIAFVEEIVGMQKISDVPEAPAYMKGIINLRGQIIPVIDMRLRLKKAPVPYDDRTCIVIVELGDVKAGLIVDHVSEVVHIPEGETVPPPDIRTGFQSRYISGIGKMADKVVLLLDCEKLFRADELQTIGDAVPDSCEDAQADAEAE